MLTKTKTTANPRAKSETDTHIGARIRQRRNELGISQQALAAELNLSFQQVQKYEKGINRVSSGRLPLIAAALQADVAYFYQRATNEAGEALPPSTLDDFVATTAGARIAKAFPQIESDGARNAIVALVEALASEAS